MSTEPWPAEAACAALLGHLIAIFEAERRPGAEDAVAALARWAADPSICRPPERRAPAPALDALLAEAAPPGGNPATDPAAAVAAARPLLPWALWDPAAPMGPPPARAPFALALLVGRGLPVEDDRAAIGLFAQAPAARYPPHAHAAAETYAVLAGTAAWSCDGRPETLAPPGQLVHHAPHAVHAVRTLGTPLLAAWRWSGAIAPESYRLVPPPGGPT